MDLGRYDGSRHDPGAGVVRRVLWYAANALVLGSWWLPWSGLKRVLLRAFGARVGRGVVIKPRANVKYPWRLHVGDHAWIGEGVWIDNIAEVRIGSHACISQGAYLCTGNHDWSDPRFALTARPIEIGDQAWVCAGALIGPGLRVGEGSVVAAGAVVARSTAPWTIVRGNPAEPVGRRTLARGSER